MSVAFCEIRLLPYCTEIDDSAILARGLEPASRTSLASRSAFERKSGGICVCRRTHPASIAHRRLTLQPVEASSIPHSLPHPACDRCQRLRTINGLVSSSCYSKQVESSVSVGQIAGTDGPSRKEESK